MARVEGGNPGKPGSAVDPKLIDELKQKVKGQVFRSGDAGYDPARTVWNGMIDRKPAVIVRVRDVADVIACVNFARTSGLPLAIRGGGHNAAGLGVCDAGLVIDLKEMHDVVVDPKKRTATAGGGTTWGEFDRATAVHGLATTGGAVSTTGIAGLTLGGGLGWLMRSCGMTCDNLIGAEVVTADGKVVRASAKENPELFWGLRGGGGNFGVVTSFEYQLHPVATIFGGMLLFPLARARDLLRLHREVSKSAPDALTVFVAMMHSPDGVPVVAAVVCFNGSAAEGEKAIKAYRSFGTPVAGEVGPMPYTALQSMLDAGFPPGLQVHWRSEFITSIPDQLIEAAVSSFEKVPSPLSAMLFEQFGGAVKRVARNDMAFDHRDSDFNLVIVSRWADPADAERNVAWARKTSEAAKPFTTGQVYVNYIGAGEAPDRVRAAFGEDKFARLVAIKRKYDPENLFRINQNIPPGS